MTEAKYDVSYTAFSLRVNDFVNVAKALVDNQEVDIENLGGGKSQTGKRQLNVITKRLEKLTAKEINLLIDSDFTTQKQISLLAACKAHLLIAEFVIEVLREKLLLFDYQFSEGEFISFFRNKCESDLQLDELSETTKAKAKQVLFKILEQAGYIDSVSNKMIQPQILTPELIKVVAEDDKNWLKVFFMSDMDIDNIRN